MLYRSFHNSTESLKFSFCTGWTYYGRNLSDLTNQYTFNVDSPWVIAICLISSYHIISIYTKMFPFKKNSLIWYAVKQCVVTNQNVLELFKNNSWLRRFLCLFIHGWPGEYCSVVNCGLPAMAFVLFLSLFIYEKCHARYAGPKTTCNSPYYCLIHLYMYLLISSFAWLSKTKRSPLILSFQFTQKSSDLNKICDFIGCKTVRCVWSTCFRIIQE